MSHMTERAQAHVRREQLESDYRVLIEAALTTDLDLPPCARCGLAIVSPVDAFVTASPSQIVHTECADEHENRIDRSEWLAQ